MWKMTNGQRNDDQRRELRRLFEAGVTVMMELTTAWPVAVIFWSANMREDPGDVAFDKNRQRGTTTVATCRIGLWGWQ